MNGSISTLIEDRKKNLGITNDQDIAYELRVAVPTVSKWRSGKQIPKPQHYERLAEWLEVSVEDVEGAVTVSRRLQASGLTEERATWNAELTRVETKFLDVLESIRQDATVVLEEIRERLDRLEAGQRPARPRKSIAPTSKSTADTPQH